MIYQQNTLGQDITVVDDAKEYAKVGRLVLGEGITPDSLVLSPDNRILYANGSNRFEAWEDPMLRTHSVFVAYDTATLEELWRIDLPGQIEHFAASPDRRYVYNAHYDRKLVTRVDTQTQEVTPIPISSMGGHKVRVSADGSKVYVGSMIWATLSEIDATTNTWTRHLVFPDNVRPLALTKDGKQAFVQINKFNGFYTVDLDAWEITGKVEMPPLPEGKPQHEPNYPFTSAHGLEISPDGKYLMSLATVGDQLAIYSLPDLALVAQLSLGEQPSYLTCSKDGTLLYVSCRVSSQLYIISMADFSVQHVVEDIGIFPQRVCVDH